MSAHSTVSAPAPPLEELIRAIRQLDRSARSRVASVLLETDLDERMTLLISRLAQRTPADEISDAELAAEVKAVRSARSQDKR